MHILWHRGLWVILMAAGMVQTGRSGWDFENGDFSEGTAHWVTHWGIDGGSGVSVSNAHQDGRSTLVLDAAWLTSQASSVLAFQNVPSRYMNLYPYGIALRGDVMVTNLPGETGGDLKAFTKLEFLDVNSNVLDAATVSGEYDASKYAASNQVRRAVTLVANYNVLAGNLQKMGRTVGDVKKIRAACFLHRYDNQETVPVGQAFFNDLTLGRVSELDFASPPIRNGDFEFENWCWMDNPYSPVSSTSGWSVVDVDGDGDKEARFDAEGLISQYDGRLWVQDFITYQVVNLTNGITLTADIAASNLTQGLRAFHKLEFGGPTFNSPPIPGVFVSTEHPNVAAMTNQVIKNSSLTMTYEILTNQLAVAGRTIHDVVYARSTLFLMQFDSGAPPPSGFAYFDNVRLDFQYAKTERSPEVQYSTRLVSNQLEISWGNCSSSSYYHIQRSVLPSQKWSNVLENVWCGDSDEILTYAFPLEHAVSSYRVIKGPYMVSPE